MLYLFIITCLIIYAVLPADTLISMGVSTDSLLNSYIYMFSHASWLHLIINSISLLIMYPPISKLYSIRYNSTINYQLSTALPTVKIINYQLSPLLLYSYLAAALAAIICATPTPTVGCSGMVFFLLGILLLLNPTKKQLKAYIWVAAAIAIQTYFGKSNVALHLVAFTFGALHIIIRESIRKITIN